MNTQTIERSDDFKTENESARSLANQDQLLSVSEGLFPRTATPDSVDLSPAIAAVSTVTYPPGQAANDGIFAKFMKLLVKLDGWVSGPPATERDRIRRNLRRADHHWLYYLPNVRP